MERKPLLSKQTGYSATEDSDETKTPESKPTRPPLRSSVSYDQLPSSISSYFGENYHCVIPEPRGRPSIDPEQLQPHSESESSANSQPIYFEVPQKHRPIFICLVSLVDFVLMVYCCIAGKVESIGLISEYEPKSVPSFGFIHESKEKQVLDHFGIYPGKNIFIGPNASFFVRMGALYPPCMRKDKEIKERIENQKKIENMSYVCCSLNGECGMMDTKTCALLAGSLQGDVSMCSSRNIKCRNNITIRPCCIGLHTKCQIMSEEKCVKLKGQWHRDKLLCGEVNCLDGICGMTGAHQTYGNQIYRLITPIFLHLGILHLVTNLVFQIIVGCKLEKEIGTILTAVIYMVSGLGGNLFSGIFTPLIPQVGSSGALFGLMGLILVYYVQNYNRLRRPCVDLCAIISVIAFSFALGTIPYIGNFVHLGGFLFGLLATIVVSKRVAYNLHINETLRHRLCRIGCFILLVALIALSFTIFYIYQDDFCPWCKFVDCIPYTKTFCPDFSSDGILNAEYKDV